MPQHVSDGHIAHDPAYESVTPDDFAAIVGDAIAAEGIEYLRVNAKRTA